MDKEEEVFFAAAVCITKEPKGCGRMFSSCIILYYQLFWYIEGLNLLDIDNELHLFCLHYAFLPRLNKSLQEFIHMWNNHPLGTEHNISPAQLWMTGEHPEDTELTQQVCTLTPYSFMSSNAKSSF